MADDASIFTDIISLTVDTDSFAADLSKLESMWGSTLDRMAEKAQDSALDPNQLIPVAAIQALQDTLTELSARANESTSQISDDIATMSASVGAELDNITAAAARTKESLSGVNQDSFSVSKRGAKRSLLGTDPDAGIGANFMNGLTMGGPENLAAMAGFMTSMSTIGTALFAVINGIKEAFMAIPHAIESGIAYLSEMEQKATELTPVIQRAAGYGNGDIGAGMKQSGAVASQVLDDLRTKAAALHLNFDQLLFTFKDLAANGGAGMVNNWTELVDVAVRLNEAVKMTVPDMQQQRVIMRDLPKLMDGTVSSSSNLLKSLGLTADQWRQIVTQAGQHRDLLSQIVTLTQEQSEANKALPGTYADLKNSLSLMLDKLEATMASPVFTQLKQWASDFMGWLDKHHDALSDIGDKLGTLVQRVMELGTALAEAAAKGFGGDHSVKELFDYLLNAAVRTVTAISGLSTIIGDVFDIAYSKAEDKAQKMQKLLEDVAHYRGEMDNTGGNKPEAKADDSTAGATWKGLDAGAYSDAIKQLSKDIADVKSKAEDFRASLQGTGEDAVEVARKTAASYATEKKTIQAKIDDFKQNGLNGASPDAWSTLVNQLNDKADADNASVDKGAAGARRSVNKALIDQMKGDVSKGLEAIKEQYAKALDDQKQMETQQTESVAQGTKHRLALLKGEQLARQQMLDDAAKKYGAVPGASRVLDALKEAVSKQNAEGDKQHTADENDTFKTTRSIDESNYKTKEQLAETHFRTMSELLKRSAQEGLMTYADAAKAEIEQQKKLYAEKRDLAVKNFNDAHKNGVDPNSEDASKFQHSLDVASAQESAQRSQDSHTLGRASLQDSSEQHSRETAAINAQLSYTQAVSDGADKQDQLNALLAKRLKADNDYLLAVERNPTHTTAEVRSAMSNVNADKLAQNNQYNATHLFQRDVTTDDAGNVTGSKGAGLFSDIEESSKAVSQAFAILEQTTKQLMQAQGNLYQKISAGAGGASSMLEGLGDSSSGLGKLGSALGMSSEVASALPGIGAAVGAVGSVVGMIGQMFAQQAKNIANDVQKKFDSIMQNYQNNTASFTQTMQALQQEQQTAIQQLSGVKGGQGFLSQILLQIQQTEAALAAQATQAQRNFEIQTAAAIQSTQVGQQWMQTWASIEQQVHDYLYKDGGNTQMAAEYQNAELAQQSLQIQQQYNQGLQQAIQDNYTLNGLMLSRQQIQLSILQLEDSMADSIERRQAPAMGLAAQQQKLQLQQLQQQLSDTTNSINIEQQKVTAENAVFGLTTDINSLHAADAASQMVALNEQLANYQEMLKIIQQISGLQASSSTGYFGGHSPFAGLPGGVPGFGATNAPTPPAQAPIVINGPITVSLPGVSGTSDVARGIAAELQNWARFGVSS